MGYPSIVWDGNTWTWTRMPEEWTVGRTNITTKTRGGTGISTGLHRYRYWTFRVAKRMLAVTDELELLAFLSWAERGNEFAIARDSGDVADTTLDGTVSAATVPLTATTSIAVGDLLLITSADRTVYEMVKVATVNAGVSVVATGNLKTAFVSGDACRHYYYLPYAKLISYGKFPIVMNDAGGANEHRLRLDVEESIQE